MLYIDVVHPLIRFKIGSSFQQMKLEGMLIENLLNIMVILSTIW
jgi:hypothetical protein